MEVRRANYNEAKAIKEFDVFVGDRRIDNWRGELFVAAADDGTIVGFVTCSSNLFYNRPFVGLLCVREGHRRQGVATALVGRVLGKYDGQDVWTSTEERNEQAIRLFEKMGFVRKGQIEGLDNDQSVEVFLCRTLSTTLSH